MRSELRRGRSHEGVPQGDPLIEVFIRIYPSPRGGSPSWPPAGGPFSGATIDWTYPGHLHGRALTRTAVVRHAFSVLLDDLDGSTTVDAQ